MLKYIIVNCLIANDGLCMDVPSERQRLANALNKALSGKGMNEIEKHDLAIALLRTGADVLAESNDVVHLPDYDIRLLHGKIHYDAGKLDVGQDVKESELANLIRYFADMIGD